jgi:carbamoyl-phosphate synthase large subunit
VTGAGTGASENLIRSLRAVRPGAVIVGCHEDRFVLRKSSAARRYLVPAPGRPAFVRALRRIVRGERVHVAIPTGDAEVLALAGARRLGCRTFLPSPAVIRLCQDKVRLTACLAERGVPVPETLPVLGLRGLGRLFARLPGRPLWCRARHGSRSLGATAVADPGQARAWIGYWERMRGLPAAAFTLSEYLPGRDFLCQSLWQRGRLILASTFERLAYFGGENTPSGVSSLSALAKTVADPRVLEVACAAVRAAAPEATGAFSVDLKENRRGVPCVTEINAGRFFIGMTAFDAVLPHNMPWTYVRLALGRDPAVRRPWTGVEDVYLVRDLDTLPGVFDAAALLDGVRDARR